MKIAITGHSRGLGKALSETLSKQHSITGYSRSNNYDISDNAVQEKIYQELQDHDVFINNAYSEFVQVELFKRVYDMWHDQDNKTIVNIVSRAKYGVGNAKHYQRIKKELAHTAMQKILSENKKCRVININPGYIRTDMVAHVPATHKMMTPEECAEIIAWTINQPHHIEIAELSCWITTL